jgi:hypothetical protein
MSARRRRVELVLLVAAGLAVVGFHASARLAAPAPWSYDEYYHLGVAREMTSHFPLRTFPWTPFSVLSEHFADKEPLFHLLLLPFARLPLEGAGLAGVLAGQLFLVAAFSWVVWRLRAPHAYAFVLGLTLLGSMFAMRVDMCRPHLLLMAFSVLVVGLLLRWPEGPPGRGALLGLAGVSALFSLAHSGAWIALFYAGVWGLAGRWGARNARDQPGAGAGRAGAGNAEAAAAGAGDAGAGATAAGKWRWLAWLPLAATAGGWLLGQLVHPNLPYNLRLLWLQNVVVPFEASPAGNAALRSQIGQELTPPTLAILIEQWPVFLAPLAAAVLLVRRPSLRTRSTMAAALLALAFLLAGSVFLRRLLEVGAPLGVLALAVVFAEAARQRPAEPQDEGTGQDRRAAGEAQAPREPRNPKNRPSRGEARSLREPRHPGDRRATPGSRHSGDRRAAADRRERRGRGERGNRAGGAAGRPLLAGWGPWIAPFVLAIGALWTAVTVRAYGLGKASPPRQMAEWLGEHGRRGERVFTAQWADSAPLFYSAPQLQSLVALDPTLFYAKDPARFQEYVDVILGRSPDPAAAIRRDFGARWVTLWRMPDYERLARQLLTPPAPGVRSPAPPAPAQLVYQDPYYLVLDLGRR